ncbi:MAG: hypothetical protein IPO32_07910 [Crocinitomicaceae bacterium]|nr:hypothetical protein [Crocinitomicaceae bacterium]
MRNWILLTAVLFCFSCNKENSKKWTEVHVSAKNFLTLEPITDISIGVYEKDALGSLEKLHSALSVDGLFDFGFKANKNKQYILSSSVDLDKYYAVSFLPYTVLYKFQLNSFEFTFVEEAHLRTHYKNVSCFDENDHIYIYRPNIDIPEYNGYSFTPMPKDGCLDIISTFSKIPCGRYHYEWHVTKNNTTNVYHDTITLNPGDSLTYLIEY